MICLKENVKGVWRRTTEAEVLSEKIPITEPFSKALKSTLPLFGFDKPVGEKSNRQQYPTHYVILELDATAFQKRKIKEGCARTYFMVRGFFWKWFTLLKHQSDLPYYWMYVTPSTCGLRFVLKLDKSVKNEEEYKYVIRQFLLNLYYRSNGSINPDHFDILVNQAWFVPTFELLFDARNAVFSIRNFKIEKPNSSKPLSIRCENKRILPGRTFSKAEEWTQQKFTYIHGQRNKYVHYLACHLNRFGVLESEALTYILSRYDLEEKEIYRTVKSAYRNNPQDFEKYNKK